MTCSDTIEVTVRMEMHDAVTITLPEGVYARDVDDVTYDLASNTVTVCHADLSGGYTSTTVDANIPQSFWVAEADISTEWGTWGDPTHETTTHDHATAA